MISFLLVASLGLIDPVRVAAYKMTIFTECTKQMEDQNVPIKKKKL